eukprot:4726410-Pleurochrysis_carterae.AAC.5
MLRQTRSWLRRGPTRRRSRRRNWRRRRRRRKQPSRPRRRSRRRWRQLQLTRLTKCPTGGVDCASHARSECCWGGRSSHCSGRWAASAPAGAERRGESFDSNAAWSGAPTRAARGCLECGEARMVGIGSGVRPRMVSAVDAGVGEKLMTGAVTSLALPAFIYWVRLRPPCPSASKWMGHWNACTKGSRRIRASAENERCEAKDCFDALGLDQRVVCSLPATEDAELWTRWRSTRYVRVRCRSKPFAKSEQLSKAQHLQACVVFFIAIQPQNWMRLPSLPSSM